MMWIWLFFVLWLPVLIFAVATDCKSCFLGFHDLECEYAEGGGKFMPRKTILRCTRCGKIVQ